MRVVHLFIAAYRKLRNEEHELISRSKKQVITDGPGAVFYDGKNEKESLCEPKPYYCSKRNEVSYTIDSGEVNEVVKLTCAVGYNYADKDMSRLHLILMSTLLSQVNSIIHSNAANLLFLWKI